MEMRRQSAAATALWHGLRDEPLESKRGRAALALAVQISYAGKGGGFTRYLAITISIVSSRFCGASSSTSTVGVAVGIRGRPPMRTGCRHRAAQYTNTSTAAFSADFTTSSNLRSLVLGSLSLAATSGTDSRMLSRKLLLNPAPFLPKPPLLGKMIRPCHRKSPDFISFDG